MQAEIELGCKITELEEILAGLRLEREKDIPDVTENERSEN